MDELLLLVRLHHVSVGIKAILDHEVVGLQPAMPVVEAQNGEVSLLVMLDVTGLPRLMLVASRPVGVSGMKMVELPINYG